MLLEYSKIILSSDCVQSRNSAISKGGNYVIMNQEGWHMPVQGSACQNDRDKFQQEQAIVRAVIKYFETAPSRQKSTTEDPESSIISAFHRYFVKKE